AIDVKAGVRALAEHLAERRFEMLKIRQVGWGTAPAEDHFGPRRFRHRCRPIVCWERHGEDIHSGSALLPGVGSEDFVRGDAEADGAHMGADANPKSNMREKMVFSFLWQPDRIIQVICQVAAVPAELTELAPAEELLLKEHEVVVAQIEPIGKRPCLGCMKS